MDRVPLEVEAALELATADDLSSGMSRVVALIRAAAEAARVEWWTPSDDGGGRELVAAAGDGYDRYEEIPLGIAGTLVLFGGRLEPRRVAALATLEPIYRRRRAEERLARTLGQLAQRNEALEDFAALVAHELKSPLQAALVAADTSPWLEQALDLVEDLLETARGDGSESHAASASAAFDRAVEDLRASEVEITADLNTMLPLPPTSLQVILRNLLANAVAAGARHIHVAAVQSARSWRLLIEDDGAGLEDVNAYAAGNGVGLALCRRIAARFGGALELAPRPSGGTRATLSLQEVPQ